MSFLKSVLTICFYILSLIVKLQNKQINAIWNYITQLGKVLAFKKIKLQTIVHEVYFTDETDFYL